MSQFTLRPELAQERSRIATLIARSYGALGAQMIDMTGQLRSLPTADKDLAVVWADDNDKAVAYALFSPLTVGNAQALLLAPLAMDSKHPEIDYNAFLQDAIAHAHGLGHSTILMHGDLQEYKALGFMDAEDKGITSDLHYPGGILLAHVQGDDNLPKGKVVYPDFIK